MWSLGLIPQISPSKEILHKLLFLLAPRLGSRNCKKQTCSREARRVLVFPALEDILSHLGPKGLGGLNSPQSDDCLFSLHLACALLLGGPDL